MPKIQYEQYRFQSKSMDLIEKVNGVIAEYEAKGYGLTLRQAYYQMVARGYIPNNPKSYDNMGAIVSRARLAGLIDWQAIEDRTRGILGYSSWDSPSDVIESAAYSFKRDLWENQPCYVEVWVEKDALKEVVSRGCRETRTPHFSCRGYNSQSEMWSAAQRFIRRNNLEKRIILYLGDHDPSGLDMTRDIKERMKLFEADVEVERIALNMEQIQEFTPPPNPAKLTDTRAKGYIKQFGSESWELDALKPDLLASLISSRIKDFMDMAAFDETMCKENEQKKELRLLSGRYADVVKYLKMA